MKKPYIFESSKNNEFGGDEAIIVLPDIYCQTDYSKRTGEEFASAFKKPVFMLDYFSLYTTKLMISMRTIVKKFTASWKISKVMSLSFSILLQNGK
jgi:hypothetical protein